MRSDMGKCIIERPRGGSNRKNMKIRAFGRFVTVDGEIEYEGIARIPASSKSALLIDHDRKDFSDVLGPLHNYLRSSCGRPWDDVYSEIARVIGRGAGWGVRHILSAHLDVATNTYRGVDGHVYDCNDHGVHRIDSLVNGWRSEFYVEPETGILRESLPASIRARRRRESVKPIEAIAISEGKEYRKIAGIWYYREFVEEEIEKPITYAGRIIRKEKVQVLLSEFKRQLGKKQLKELALRNG